MIIQCEVEASEKEMAKLFTVESFKAFLVSC